ncbi:MAG: molybdopterin cofactor-binding domain-containing protein, partial [Pseudomonadota bacterium]
MTDAHTVDGTAIGAAVLRVEDERLLTGRGAYTDDFNVDGQVYAAVARATEAHAEIVSIDLSTVRSMPGVLSVLTGADLRADGLQPLAAQGNPKDVELKNQDGSPIFYPGIELLATDTVRRVGEGIALVVAESDNAAADAAAHIHASYRTRRPVVDPVSALAMDAPRLWREHGSNICVDDRKGDIEAVEDAFGRAHFIAKLEVVNNRVTGVPMEPRAAIGLHDPETDLFTLYAGGQGVNRFQRELSTA